MAVSTYFDIIIVFIIIILSLKGLFNGFLRELFSALGIVGGVLIASRFSQVTGQALNSLFNFQSQTLVNLIGFMFVLGVIWIASIIIAEILVRFAKFIRLGAADKFLGVFMAGIKIFLVLSIILSAFSKINFLDNFTNKLQAGSKIYPLMINVGSVIMKTELASEIRQNAIEGTKNSLELLNNELNGIQKARESIEQRAKELQGD